MKIALLVSLLAMLHLGCNDDGVSRDGVYKGTFHRSTPTENRIITSQVTLELSGGKFAGVSSITQYPAICSGSYTTEEDVIVFSNECVFTADFDGTLILDGRYEIKTVEGTDSLYLIQRVLEDQFNVYQLALE